MVLSSLIAPILVFVNLTALRNCDSESCDTLNCSAFQNIFLIRIQDSNTIYYHAKNFFVCNLAVVIGKEKQNYLPLKSIVQYKCNVQQFALYVKFSPV